MPIHCHLAHGWLLCTITYTSEEPYTTCMGPSVYHRGSQRYEIGAYSWSIFSFLPTSGNLQRYFAVLQSAHDRALEADHLSRTAQRLPMGRLAARALLTNAHITPSFPREVPAGTPHLETSQLWRRESRLISATSSGRLRLLSSRFQASNGIQSRGFQCS